MLIFAVSITLNASISSESLGPLFVVSPSITGKAGNNNRPSGRGESGEQLGEVVA